MTPLDPRTWLYQPELAEISLKGKIEAIDFADLVPYHVVGAVVPLKSRPEAYSLASQLLFGERFDVLRIHAGFAWGRALNDGYCGYVPAEYLQQGIITPPLYRVHVLRSFIYPTPSMKSEPLTFLPLGAEIREGHQENAFMYIEPLKGWIYAKHVQLAKVQPSLLDMISIARCFLGVPYLWGGKTSLGLDCSALIQTLLLIAQQIYIPRDSDQQREKLADFFAPTTQPWQSGDILFFPGHVGMMSDAEHLIHANAFHMQVTEEKLSEVLSRFDDPASAILKAYRTAQST
ncbi:MAG: NlpC/P60 family protein [Alphaproteobacteria bacterium]